MARPILPSDAAVVPSSSRTSLSAASQGRRRSSQANIVTAQGLSEALNSLQRVSLHLGSISDGATGVPLNDQGFWRIHHALTNLPTIHQRLRDYERAYNRLLLVTRPEAGGSAQVHNPLAEFHELYEQRCRLGWLTRELGLRDQEIIRLNGFVRSANAAQQQLRRGSAAPLSPNETFNSVPDRATLPTKFVQLQTELQFEKARFEYESSRSLGLQKEVIRLEDIVRDQQQQSKTRAGDECLMRHRVAELENIVTELSSANYDRPRWEKERRQQLLSLRSEVETGRAKHGDLQAQVELLKREKQEVSGQLTALEDSLDLLDARFYKPFQEFEDRMHVEGYVDTEQNKARTYRDVLAEMVNVQIRLLEQRLKAAGRRNSQSEHDRATIDRLEDTLTDTRAQIEALQSQSNSPTTPVELDGQTSNACKGFLQQIIGLESVTDELAQHVEAGQLTTPDDDAALTDISDVVPIAQQYTHENIFKSLRKLTQKAQVISQKSKEASAQNLKFRDETALETAILLTEKEKLKNQVSDKDLELQSATIDAENLRDELRRTTANLDKVQLELNDLAHEKIELLSEQENQAREHSNTISAMNAELSSKAREVLELQTDNKGFTTTISELQTSTSNEKEVRKDEVKLLREGHATELLEKQQSIADLQYEKTGLQHKVDEQYEETVTVRRRMQGEMADLTTKLAERCQENVQLRHDLQVTTEEKDSLLQQNRGMIPKSVWSCSLNRAKMAEEVSSKRYEEIITLKKQVNDQQTLIDDLEQNKAADASEIARLEIANAGHESHVARLLSDLRSLQKRLGVETLKTEELENSLSEKQEEFRKREEEFQESIREYGQQVVRLHLKSVQLEAALNQHKEELKHSSQERDELKESLGQKTEEANRLRSQIARKTTQINQIANIANVYAQSENDEPRLLESLVSYDDARRESIARAGVKRPRGSIYDLPDDIPNNSVKKPRLMIEQAPSSPPPSPAVEEMSRQAV